MATAPLATRFRLLLGTAGNGAGARTVTGARVGDRVIGVINLTDLTDGAASFETTVTVADQVQQSATNLTSKVCMFSLRGRASPRL